MLRVAVAPAGVELGVMVQMVGGTTTVIAAPATRCCRRRPPVRLVAGVQMATEEATTRPQVPSHENRIRITVRAAAASLHRSAGMAARRRTVPTAKEANIVAVTASTGGGGGG
jgi:hypothetical protein